MLSLQLFCQVLLSSLSSNPRSPTTLETSFHFPRVFGRSSDLASFGFPPTQKTDAMRVSFAILSTTILMALFRIASFLFTLDFDLREEGDGDDDKDTLIF